MYLLAYDDGCGPCTRFRNVVAFLDARRMMDYAGLDAAERLGGLESIPASRRHRSFHLVSPDGRTWSGASALPHLVALIPGGRPLSVAMRVPPVFSTAAFMYGVFSRLHDSGACRYGPGEPAASGATQNLRKHDKPMADFGVTDETSLP